MECVNCEMPVPKRNDGDDHCCDCAGCVQAGSCYPPVNTID